MHPISMFADSTETAEFYTTAATTQMHIGCLAQNVLSVVFEVRDLEPGFWSCDTGIPHVRGPVTCHILGFHSED